MDSVTQIALGSAVGHAVLGRQAGRRAALWGAVCGTLPDLDVLVPLADPVATFTYHRSASHSLIILTLAAPLLAWLIRRCHRDLAHLKWRWLLLVWLVLVTHVLLDALTVYGTQLFWPLTDYPVSGSVVFIIDPLYTLPLLVGLGVALWARDRDRARHWNTAGLVLSSLYLIWAASAKAWVDHRVEQYLVRFDMPHTQVLSIPSSFNTLLWRIVVMDRDGYYEGFYSLLDGSGAPTFTRHPSDPALLAALDDSWAAQRLLYFTHGFCSVIETPDGAVVITDLRMGMREQYVFGFQVGQRAEDGAIVPAPSARQDFSYRSRQLDWVWQRLWRPDA